MTHTNRNTRRPTRRFQLRQGDPRIRRSGQQHIRRNQTREQTITQLGRALQHARENALSRGTKLTQKSQLAYWAEFCNLFELDEQDFGKVEPGATRPSLQQIRYEEDILSAFMAFVVACPRKGSEQNTASYAPQCISAVRSHYNLLNGRRPGLRDGSRTGGQLQVVIRGFQNTNPGRKKIKLPLLQQHLRAIRETLQLHTNPYHKALWALWLTQWQGVLRTSDLVSKRRDAARPWIAEKETHRGRISVDLAKDLHGNPLGPRINILLKPNKTDQSGEKRTIKSFVIDDTPGALSRSRNKGDAQS